MAQGDHLRVVRGGEVDHAIDVGDRTVIRWRAEVGVERVERAVFAPEGATVEVVLHRERAFRPPLVVARAFSRFAESAYRAMFQSAEQFAAWCKSAQFPVAPAAPVRKAKVPAARKPAAMKPVAKAAKTRPAPAKQAAKARKAAPKKVARAKKAAPRKAAARKVAPRKKAAKARPAKKVAGKAKRR